MLINESKKGRQTEIDRRMLQQNTSRRIIRKDFSQENDMDIEQKLVAKIRMYLQPFSVLPPAWLGRTYDAKTSVQGDEDSGLFNRALGRPASQRAQTPLIEQYTLNCLKSLGAYTV